MKKTVLLSGLLAGALLTGCSSVHPSITKTITTATNGAVTESFTIDLKSATGVQAQTALDKFRAAITKNGASIGIASLDQKSDTAALVEAFGQLLKDLGDAAKNLMAAWMAAQSGGLVGTGGVRVPAVPAYNQADRSTWPTSIKALPDGTVQVCWANGACLIVPLTFSANGTNSVPKPTP